MDLKVKRLLSYLMYRVIAPMFDKFIPLSGISTDGALQTPVLPKEREAVWELPSVDNTANNRKQLQYNRRILIDQNGLRDTDIK